MSTRVLVPVLLLGVAVTFEPSAFAAPSATAAAAIATSPAGASKGAQPQALGVTLPIPGTGHQVRVEYSGPVAPWKVLNPFHHGERRNTVSVLGPVEGKSGKRSERDLTVRTDVESWGHAAELRYSSVHPGGRTPTTSVVASTSKRKGGSGYTGENALSASVTKPTTTGGLRTVRFDAKSTKEIARGQVPKRSQIVEVSEEIAHAGGSTKNAIAVTRDRARDKDDTALRAGRTQTGGDGKTTEEGVVVKRDKTGDLSTELVGGGNRRVHSVEVGEETHPPSVFKRLKDAIWGQKKGDAFKNGVPTPR